MIGKYNLVIAVLNDGFGFSRGLFGRNSCRRRSGSPFFLCFRRWRGNWRSCCRRSCYRGRWRLLFLLGRRFGLLWRRCRLGRQVLHHGNSHKYQQESQQQLLFISGFVFWVVVLGQFRLKSISGHGIVAAPHKRIAPENTPDGQQCSAKESVERDCLGRIFRAGGNVPAGRRKNGRDNRFVKPETGCRQRLHFALPF